MGFCFIGKDMKKEKFGVPYMGSKRGISDKIVDYILSYNPNVKYIYDLLMFAKALSTEPLLLLFQDVFGEFLLPMGA